MDALESKLTRALADLGDSPEAVAAVLEAQGCKGYRANAGYCPVANYLARTLGVRMANVDRSDASVLREPTGWVHVETPPAVGEFIANFDSGCYRNLEAKR